MKTISVLSAFALGASLLTGRVAVADEHHDADEGLEGTLRSTLNERHVHVHVNHGVVTLDGEVRTEADRQRIDSLVRNTSGVVALKDKLHVTFPSPGGYGANPAAIPVPVVPATIPVYSAPLPPVTTGPTVMTAPVPVVIPDYPKLKVQAWTSDDQPEASRIASQLRADAVPTGEMENVTITVRQGNVSLQGTVDTHTERDALIAAVQRAGGATAIYDQLQIR